MIPADVFFGALIIGTTIFFTWFVYYLVIVNFVKQSSKAKRILVRISYVILVLIGLTCYLF